MPPMVGPESLALLLDHLPDVYVFVKDKKGRFIFCNRAFVALQGAKSEDDVLGRTDADFSPRHLCEKYAKDDHEVLTTGKRLVDEIELVRNRDGSISWHNTTKLPVTSASGAIVAVAGVTRDLKKMVSASARFLTMTPVVETIMNDYGSPLSVPALAAKVSLSVSQFERQFKERFRMTPLKYIVQVRVNAASELLAGTDLPIIEIAGKTGFYDQSHFTNHFAKLKGMTPHQYRRRYRRAGAAVATASRAPARYAP